MSNAGAGRNSSQLLLGEFFDPYDLAMDDLILPPELERFAAEAVAFGRYRDTTEVVRAGLSLLREAEAEIAAFMASLKEAEAEAERDGFFSADEVHREMTARIGAMGRQKA